ncbi:MAG: glycosyltransferase [Oscillospiraceae bacterium]|nr:glycosyltransferase [Oscillospiraceae bacterium]
MRIAIFSETYVPYLNGVVTHVKVLNDGLKKAGHQTLVVCADSAIKKHKQEEGVLYCPGFNFKKIYGYGIARPVSKNRRNIIKEFAPDIIHIHTEFGVGFSGFRAAKALGVPLVYTLHTMYDDYLYYIVPKAFISIARRLAHKYLRYLGNGSQSLIAPSEKAAEYLHNIGVTKEIDVIPNSIETDVFDPDVIDKDKINQIKEKYRLDGKFTVCFCGRLGKEKNIDGLLEFWSQTVKKTDRLMLMIMGTGPNEEEYRSLAKELGIDDMVAFAGKVPHDEIPPYYSAADAYITASLSEVNSISTKEAMACGLPVLHIDDKMNRGQVIEGVNGFIFDSAQEMYSRLIDCRDMDRDEFDKLKTSTRRSVAEVGSQKSADEVLRVYAKAMNDYNIG